MTKLEEEMVDATWATRFNSDPAAAGKAAAEVAKMYIVKAWHRAVLWRERYEGMGQVSESDYEEDISKTMQQWLKENGITE